jgi:methionine-rich copper-binding protein CopC
MRLRLSIVGLIPLLALLVPTLALAHAELRSATPEPGNTLTASPAEVRLTFSEPLGPGSFIEVYGQGFRSVGPLEVGVDPAHPEQLVALLPALDRGAYTVQWSAASDDGHEISGSYAFNVMADQPARERTGVVLALSAGAGVALLLFFLTRRRSPTRRLEDRP